MTRTEKQLFVGLLLLGVVLISRGSQALHGNAPYHLAISHSLVHDLDLDLSTQFDPTGAYLFQRDLTGAYARPGRDGRLYPSQGIGFGVALAPVFAAAEGVATIVPAAVLEAVRWNRERSARDLISAALALLFAWTGVLAWRFDRAIRGVARGSLVGVLLVFITMPLLGASILALTELSAASLLLWFATRQLMPVRHPLLTMAPALLPWLHLRYSLVAIAAVVWVAAGRRREGDRGAALVWPAVPLLLSLGLLAVAEWWMFGTLMPYGPAIGPASAGAHLWTAVAGLAGLLVDPDFGLLVVAPFWLVGIASLPALLGRRPDYVRFSLAALGGLAIATVLADGWREDCPPALALAPALPLLVPLVSEGLVTSTGLGRWLAAVTAAWALSVTALTIDRPGRLWTETGTGIGRLPVAGLSSVAAFYSPARRLERAGIGLDNETFVERAAEGDVRSVDLFLRAGFPPGVALEAAARAGQVEVLDRLLAAGVEAGPPLARTLLTADLAGHAAIVDRLKAAGASLDAADASGETALVEAIRQGAADQLEQLLERGASVHTASRTGWTAIFFAAEAGDDLSLGRLIGAGAEVNVRDIDGWTPLMLATRHGHAGTVRTLITSGADVDAMSRLGWTALMLAAHDGDLAIVQTLLAHGADVNVASRAGLSALVRGVQRGHAAVVRTLVAGGADVDAVVGGRDARTWAAGRGEPELADLLTRGRRHP
ncbi:MAG TPA: ankyrin repeat domain-containing protein [Vicinamibacterales bacterium]|nr:ankyrin repeat domain-containing protein [Vicinamibacterales bacterium]